MMLQPIVKPVFLGVESDQNPSWPAMARDDHFAPCGQAKVLRQIILDLGQSYRLSLANPRRRARLAPLLW